MARAGRSAQQARRERREMASWWFAAKSRGAAPVHVTCPRDSLLLVYGLFLIGVPVLVFFLVGIVLEGLILKRHVLADTLWGTPYMVLLAEVLATIGYTALKPHLWGSSFKPSLSWQVSTCQNC